jgi:S1-C subfamily serine protease
VVAASLLGHSHAICGQSQSLDLSAIAKRARPAVWSVIVARAGARKLGAGTAFAISSDGALVTNWHVIKIASRVIAKNDRGEKFVVRGVLAEDARHDIAVLKIDANDLPSPAAR